MEFPLISVIIPTYGREEVLCSTLADVLQQHYPAFEVVVVDQTPQHEPKTQQYLDQLEQQGKIRLFRVLWANLPAARNYGVRRSRGEIVLFIDDDVQLPNGFLAAHSANFQRDPKIGAVAGRVRDRQKLLQDDTTVVRELPPEAHDPAIAWYYLDLVRTVNPQPVLTARGCNMSFRRSLFDHYGLWFDERFSASAVREESDFCLRIRSTGLIIWYDPAAELVHLGEESGGCHDISTRSLRYQLTFYHHHFWLGIKNLTPGQLARFSGRLFDCHVLGHPPCYKSRSVLWMLFRGCFFLAGLLSALSTLVRSFWDDGQIYSQLDAEHENSGRKPHLYR